MLDASLTNRLGALGLALTDAQVRALGSAAGLGPSAAAVITTLGPHGGLPIRAMSTVLGLSHSATVRVIDRLAAAGLVARERGPDRRQVRLRLTAAGRRVRGRVVTARQRAVAHAVAGWSEPDRVRLDRLVHQLLQQLAVDRERADQICRLCDETVCAPDICPVERGVAGRPAM